MTMEPTADVVLIDEEKAAKRMRKALKSSFDTAREAHDKAMKSKSELAKYNSYTLRRLEKAFAADPEVDILSKLQNYNASAEELRNQEPVDAKGIVDVNAPHSKRLKPTTDALFSPGAEISSCLHLQNLIGPNEVLIKTPLAATVLLFFPQGCSQRSVLNALAQCEIISQDNGCGNRIILKMDDTIVVKVVPSSAGTQEYSALGYLEKHCTGVPAPKPLGMLELNGYFLMFISHLPGESLDHIWPSLDWKQKIAISTQLDSIFSKLRSHKLPLGEVWGGIGGEGCIDRRRDIRQSTEEIRDPRDFREFFFSNPKFGSSVWIAFLQKLYNVGKDDSEDQDCCVLTHGDLRLANIIVQWEQGHDINISGIVDWEYSGFYPAYWEAIKLTNCMGPHEEIDWFLHVPAVISPQRYMKRWLLNLVWDRHVD